MSDDEEVILGHNGVVEWWHLRAHSARHKGPHSPETECHACTVGVAEAKFVQSILLDWGVRLRSSISLTTVVQSRSGDRLVSVECDTWKKDTCQFIPEELHTQRVKLTWVKGTEIATDVTIKHVDATTLMKCVVTIGLINRTSIFRLCTKSNVSDQKDSDAFIQRTVRYSTVEGINEHAMRTSLKSAVMVCGCDNAGNVEM